LEKELNRALRDLNNFEHINVAAQWKTFKTVVYKAREKLH